MRRPDPVRLKRGHRLLVYAVTGVLFLSGVIWGVLNYGPINPNDFAAAVKSLSMKIHGAAAMAILVLIGTLLNTHVKSAWCAGRNRVNGSILLGVLSILILTGYGLYYAGGEKLRACASWTHLAIGLALPALLLVHILLGKRTRSATRPPSRAQFPVAQ